jgi:chemotaxis family two-component system response regulator Rcp1
MLAGAWPTRPGMPAAPPRDPQEQASMKAVMIDDEADEHRLMQIICQRYDLQVGIEHHTDAEGGWAALLAAKTRGQLPDLVILDLDMPRLTGVEILKRIRADDILRPLTVAVITGSLAPEDRAACAAADHFYYKPRNLDGWVNIVLLLRRMADERDPGRAPVAAIQAAPPAHLLHIDDDPDDRELFARAFAQGGTPGSLHQVASVAEALLFLNRLGPHQQAPRPSLIVLDLGLPGVDGRGFLQALRANTRFRQIPVIVLTGSQRYDDIERCRDLQVEDYVIKPATSQELQEFLVSLRRWLTAADGAIPASPNP